MMAGVQITATRFLLLQRLPHVSNATREGKGYLDGGPDENDRVCFDAIWRIQQHYERLYRGADLILETQAKQINQPILEQTPPPISSCPILVALSRTHFL